MLPKFGLFALVTLASMSFISGLPFGAQADDKLTGAEVDASETAKVSKAVTPSASDSAADSKSAEAGAAAESSGEKYLLRYKFVPDQRVHYEVAHEMQITTQFNEATEVAHNKSSSRKHYRVVSVDDTGAGDLELMIDWVHMSAWYGEGEKVVEFKSDDPNLQPEKFKHVSRTIGKPQATIKFNTLGQPIEVSATAPTPATANRPEKAASPSESSYESYLFPLPTAPVAVGETWKERFELGAQTADNLTIKIAMLRVYKLEQVKDGQATVGFKTSILTPIHDGSIGAQLIQRETAGKIVLDLERGFILSRDVNVDRTVINPFGSKSSMRAVSQFRERLVPAGVTAGRIKGSEVRPGNSINK